MTINYNGKVTIPINTEITLTIDTKDIIRWIDSCTNAKTLKYISKYARTSAQAIENPDDDDFRSRA